MRILLLLVACEKPVPTQPVAPKAESKVIRFAAVRDAEQLQDTVPGAEALAASQNADVEILWVDDPVAAVLDGRADVATSGEVKAPLKKTMQGWITSETMVTACNEAQAATALTKHRGASAGGDLDAVKQRKVLRVGLQNTLVSYYIYRGERVGFQFELARMLAEQLGVRLDVWTQGDLEEDLRAGRIDVAALPIPDVPPDGLLFSRPFVASDHVVVQRADEALMGAPEQLAGRQLVVRRTYDSSAQTLREQVPSVRVEPSDASTEELIDAVANKRVDLTVANSLLARAELRYRHDVQLGLELAKGRGVAFAVRADAPQLLAAVDAFVKQAYRGRDYNVIYKRYFENDSAPATQPFTATRAGQLSPFDDSAKALAKKYGLDWRLIVAQAYQESRFDPHARSFAGALGLLQIMPRTAGSLGFATLTDPMVGLEAGVRYFKQLLDRFDTSMELNQRLRFALAAYNAGPGHVHDARALAKERGLDAGRWFGNVEQAMLLLEQREYYARFPHGYVRGREPVKYVSQIQTAYDAYTDATSTPSQRTPPSKHPSAP